MYESHFGLNGQPFQLNPDPAFYFDSRGHSSALAYLKYGAHQGEGFIVVTGEIGAGKTTLVRTLLEGLNTERLVAAQVVSTQLEAGDLLRTILSAFGAPSSGTTKAQLIASLEAFLTSVAARGRRALLVVDEAQNLGRDAVEELRMLSNFQLGTHGLLQSFLVGQPELRVLLQSKSMEQLRQRVIASCHLGPLDPLETRAYIEHRLRHVGWVSNPSFDDDAFGRIHHWSGGIPRRINRLCNRLLLGAYLADQTTITVDSVERTAVDLGAEIGESVVSPMPVGAPLAAEARLTGLQLVADNAPVEVIVNGPSKPGAPLLCLVDTLTEYVQAGALSRVLADHPSLPSVVLVHMGGSTDLDLGLDTTGVLSRPALDIHLSLDDRNGVNGMALALTRFAAILDEYKPVAVMAMGCSNSLLACSIVARKRDVPVLRTNAGRRSAWATEGEQTNVKLIDQFADVLYTDNLVTHYALHHVGIPSDRVHCVGDLAANVVHMASSLPLSARANHACQAVANGQFRSDASFALVTKQFHALKTDPVRVREAVAMLTMARAEIPLLWAVDNGTLLEIKASGAEDQLKTAGILVITDLGYVDCLALIGRSRCVIAGPEARFVDESRVLGTPSVVIDSGLVVPVRVSGATGAGVAAGSHQLRKVLNDLLAGEPTARDGLDYWDGGAALKIATHLDAWLRRHNRSRSRLLSAAEPAAVPHLRAL